jgi:16S rRNA (guanine527-N7)-methyltransferase
MNLAAALSASVAELGLSLPAPALERLIQYLRLLEKWNRVYRLSGVRDPAKMLSHHLLDALAVVPHVTGRAILDVGSGAGLPGIPIAVALQDSHVTLLDSNQKKAGFMQQAAIEMELRNVDVVCERVEQWRPAGRFDFVISRAFAEIGEFVRLAGTLCAPHGVLAAMKGVYPHQEIAQLPTPFKLKHVVPLDVPRVGGARHLVLLERSE